MAATEALTRITATVGYLRIHVAPDGADREWIRCEDLTDDSARLQALAREAGPLLGTDEQDVALSLFVQGYAFRIASAAIGGWLLTGEIVDVAPSGMDIALGRGRPNAVRFHHPRIAAGAPAPVEALHAHLVDGHLARIVAAAHEVGRIGEALLWGNVAASIASGFGTFMDPLPERKDDIGRAVETFFATARPELARAGEITPVGARWIWQRNACCLWFRTQSAFRCEDCSLSTSDERYQRRQSKLAEQVSAGEIAG